MMKRLMKQWYLLFVLFLAACGGASTIPIVPKEAQFPANPANIKEVRIQQVGQTKCDGPANLSLYYKTDGSFKEGPMFIEAGKYYSYSDIPAEYTPYCEPMEKNGFSVDKKVVERMNIPKEQGKQFVPIAPDIVPQKRDQIPLQNPNQPKGNFPGPCIGPAIYGFNEDGHYFYSKVASGCSVQDPAGDWCQIRQSDTDLEKAWKQMGIMKECIKQKECQ
jgi:hypothetical protein